MVTNAFSVAAMNFAAAVRYSEVNRLGAGQFVCKKRNADEQKRPEPKRYRVERLDPAVGGRIDTVA